MPWQYRALPRLYRESNRGHRTPVFRWVAMAEPDSMRLQKGRMLPTLLPLLQPVYTLPYRPTE